MESYQFASWLDGDECGNHNLLMQTTLSGSERVNLNVTNHVNGHVSMLGLALEHALPLF